MCGFKAFKVNCSARFLILKVLLLEIGKSLKGKSVVDYGAAFEQKIMLKGIFVIESKTSQ